MHSRNSLADKSDLRFGAFIAGFHDFSENPALALERDFQLVEHLDRLGFDEAWIGEHHSGGLELIGSPEIFIAAAAQRTRNIKLGTGVVSLPYHHPFMVAERITQLDYQTNGRLMFGIGAGSLASDAHILGADPATIRDRMREAIEVIIPLLEGHVVSKEASWFTLKEARVQLPCLTNPYPELVIASTASPSGPRLAGLYGGGVLSLGVTTQSGMDTLAATWKVWCESARMHEQSANRNAWRLAGPVHIAETREQALRDVRYGMCSWISYLNRLTPLQVPAPIEAERDVDIAIEAILATEMGVIGTPDDLITKIEALWESSGGFGCWLDMVPTWADFPAKLRSYELIAHYVIPHFKATNRRRDASFSWAATYKERFLESRKQAVESEKEKWAREREQTAGDDAHPPLTQTRADEPNS
jgi:limonene 1,2-monooxygenase